jgi:hypothetical protein
MQESTIKWCGEGRREEASVRPAARGGGGVEREAARQRGSEIGGECVSGWKAERQGGGRDMEIDWEGSRRLR